jgi:replicative DNA helicase
MTETIYPGRTALEQWTHRLKSGVLGEREDDTRTWVLDDLWQRAMNEQTRAARTSAPPGPASDEPPPPEDREERVSAPPELREPRGRFVLEDLTLAEPLVREKTKPVDAVPTMLPSLNTVCGGKGGRKGFGRGWYVIVGGTTGQGKTLFACNLAGEANRRGEKVCFMSLEMDADELYTRMDAEFCGEDIRLLEQGPDFEYERGIAARSVRIKHTAAAGGGLWVNQESLESLEDIDRAFRWHHEKHGCRFYVVDYLQLAWVEGTEANILAQITAVSHRLRKLTRELGVVTIGVSQLNREASKDYETPPTPHALMGGSPLENDATLVLLLDHTTYEMDDDGRGATQKLILGKNRHGQTKKLDVVWSYRTMRCREHRETPAPELPLEVMGHSAPDFRKAAAGEER